MGMNSFGFMRSCAVSLQELYGTAWSIGNPKVIERSMNLRHHRNNAKGIDNIARRFEQRIHECS